jgi:CubicO group peptidase (beta-lactamase class C family)
MKLIPFFLATSVLSSAFCPYADSQAGPDFVPQEHQDGWSISKLEAEGLSATPLRQMERPIRAGDFKKIGSVVIARHGKLIYETYFDGDVTTLRDTRSATKSITDILVGIAIREKKLSGVDARVLALLPERARKMQNPIRARTK